MTRKSFYCSNCKHCSYLHKSKKDRFYCEHCAARYIDQAGTKRYEKKSSMIFTETKNDNKQTDKGTKNDDNKADFSLIPSEALYALASMYTLGAKKYGRRNWEKGLKKHRVFSALMRHLLQWQAGESYDQEDGQHHLMAVVWNALALFTYEIRGLITVGCCGNIDKAKWIHDFVRKKNETNK